MLEIAAPVREALEVGRPVVALESTLIAHGLPWPRNLETALALEADLLAAGVLPATIAVLDGAARIGLDAAQLERIAQPGDTIKASSRDLSLAIAQRHQAATTVSATAHLAHRAGIRVFATGGLGGVHRDAPYDESADLVTLSGTPITVVCSGVKSILDVPATLERLETLGVAIAGWRTDRFPGFYLRDSGERLDWRVESGIEVAQAMAARDALGLRGGLIVANEPNDPLDAETHERVLREGLAAAQAAGVTGKATTPFLLDHFHVSTAGRSLEVNISIVRGNVRVAAEIATAWSVRQPPPRSLP